LWKLSPGKSPAQLSGGSIPLKAFLTEQPQQGRAAFVLRKNQSHGRELEAPASPIYSVLYERRKGGRFAAGAPSASPSLYRAFSIISAKSFIERLVPLLRYQEPFVLVRIRLKVFFRPHGAEEILEICKSTETPMIFDLHHHIVKEKLSSYEHSSVAKLLRAARLTWPRPDWQIIHVSNRQQFFQDPRHSETIKVFPTAALIALWIEIEAKGKEKRQSFLNLLHGWRSWTPLKQYCLGSVSSPRLDL
jgi:hypothetical protein